jgi:hypothetical protein
MVDLTSAMPCPSLRCFFYLPLFSSSLLLFFAFALRLCVSARDILLPAVHASLFQPVDAAADAVFHQRDTEANHAVLLLS